MFCISCGFSDICCNKLAMGGFVTAPVLGGVVVVVPSGLEADHGFGSGSRFSVPCWGFAPVALFAESINAVIIDKILIKFY